MKFCPECGTSIEGMKFCPECGYKVVSDNISAVVEKQQEIATPQRDIAIGEQTILEFSTYMFGLEDKKADIAGGRFDISLPQYRYTLTNERLLAEKKGVVQSKREEFELFKLRDVSVKQSFVEKAQKIGTILVTSTDPGTPILKMERIKNPENIKEAIRTAAQARKAALNIQYHEGTM